MRYSKLFRSIDESKEKALYVQHGVTGRWGRYVRGSRTNTSVKVHIQVDPKRSVCEARIWDRAAVCASVVTPRRIW